MVLLLLGLFWGAQARAQAQVNAPRMALLIGNSAYTGEWRPLTPTINDANDLGQRLAELGWQTTVLTNRTLDNMMSDVRNFVERAKQARAGQLLVYFAGHGLEWEQGGFLIPVGLETADGHTVSYRALSVQRLLSDLQHAPGLKLILLDACRTRPRGRGAGGGLPALTPPEGLFLHYATRAMQVALEFPGQRNGVYASGLLSALNNVAQNGGRFTEVIVATEKNVWELSRQQQRPELYGSLSLASPFEFAVVPPVQVSATTPISALTPPTTPAPTTPAPTTVPVSTLMHGRYQILRDGNEVKDTQTNLIWARCSVGQSWDGRGCTGEVTRFTDQTKLQANNDWRVPTVSELHSLVWCSTGKTKFLEKKKGIRSYCDGDYKRPTIRSDVFPQTPLLRYWSSSIYSDGDTSVEFDDGGTSNHVYNSYGDALRLVRVSDTSSWTDYSGPIEYNWLYDTGDKFDPKKTSSTKVDTETVPTLLHGRYQILGDGSVVKDSQTALIWARCSLGQKWDGSGCAGMAKKFTFDQAQRFASEVEASIQQGTNKWRIPTLNELQSLVWCGSGEYVSWALPSTESVRSIYARCEGDFNRPTIRNDVFPQTASGIWPFTFFWGTYWTSSPNLDNSSSAWGVNFSNGSVRVGGDHFGSTVRLVSSSKSISSVTTTVSPTVPVSKESSNRFSDWDTTFSFPIDRYQISADGSEVKDIQTGLIWARCSVGQRWDGRSCSGEARRFRFDDLQTIVGTGLNGWRIPTVRELHSLVWCSTGKTKWTTDPKDGKGTIGIFCNGGSYYSPTIRSDVFPQTPARSSYWSSSQDIDDSNKAWGVNFYIGNVEVDNRLYGRSARLVR